MSHDLRPPTSAPSDTLAAHRFHDLETVQLREDLPEHGLKRGEVGTIVHVFETAEAYLVEFTNDAEGSTKALVELTPAQINPA